MNEPGSVYEDTPLAPPEQESPAVQPVTPIEHWAYHSDTPLRPVHEILQNAETGYAPVSEVAKETAWKGTAEQIAFREAVLRAHLARSRRRKGPPGRDLTPAELAPVAGTGMRMRRDAAEAAGRLIAAANEALAQAKQAGDPDALKTRRVTATSGYRGSEHQARLWRGYFPSYYDRTVRQREGLASGPHGAEAVNYMIKDFGVPKWIAAPGYSNHQSGIAIDLQQERTGAPIRNSSQKAALAAWRGSWLYRWLTQNAASFGFQPYPKEPWHWEYRPATSEQGSPAGEEYEPQFEPEELDLYEEPEYETEPGEEADVEVHEEDTSPEHFMESEVLESEEPLPHAQERATEEAASAAPAGGFVTSAETAEQAGTDRPAMVSLDQLEPLLGEAESFLDLARATYRDTVDAVRTRIRIGQGVVDGDRLTDMVFFDRHPDRAGRPPALGDPDFAALHRKWLDIRDRVVRPALQDCSRPRRDRA
ncbi:hypothetical protein Acsp04_65320 [Actinomadura sp. NBRC 104425]|uniref:M15 family metallopeptidase n=1 Tax=Actinomadura sp. NBRC 104425 TaxID=3032204 RepID=UPI0024A0310D|nr:M15 family metallopeptidase [Actinomadura sp. NBRC 104425]GLZ16297.1 hypothetical protein Acsp04_65320 [Actinomadura sp. NBRC 104425]